MFLLFCRFFCQTYVFCYFCSFFCTCKMIPLKPVVLIARNFDVHRYLRSFQVISVISVISASHVVTLSSNKQYNFLQLSKKKYISIFHVLNICYLQSENSNMNSFSTSSKRVKLAEVVNSSVTKSENIFLNTDLLSIIFTFFRIFEI